MNRSYEYVCEDELDHPEIHADISNGRLVPGVPMAKAVSGIDVYQVFTAYHPRAGVRPKTTKPTTWTTTMGGQVFVQ